MKLPAVSKIAIKNVKKDKYAIKRIKCGSSPIYSNEYKCTSEETKKTTMSIVADNESNRKTHSMFKISTATHEIGNITRTLAEHNVTS